METVCKMCIRDRTYTVTVHVDYDGDMVIIQNPTLAPAMEKSSYEPKAQEADNSVRCV